jgi:hypothetical protein
MQWTKNKLSSFKQNNICITQLTPEYFVQGYYVYGLETKIDFVKWLFSIKEKVSSYLKLVLISWSGM